MGFKRIASLLCVLIIGACNSENRLDTVEASDIYATQATSAVVFQDLDKKLFPEVTTTTTTTFAPPAPPATTIPPTTTTTHHHHPPTTSAPKNEAVEEAAAPQDTGVNWDAIAECESGGNWSINTGNGYYGGLQFSHSTWVDYGGEQFAENAHLTSRANQIAIASNMSLRHWPKCGRYG